MRIALVKRCVSPVRSESPRHRFYAAELVAGLVDGAAEPTVANDSGCCAVLDGNNALGYAAATRTATAWIATASSGRTGPLPRRAVVATRAVNLAISKARTHGVGWVVCRRSNHFGAAGFWAQKAMEAGMLGFAFTNTAPFMVPTGGLTRAVGTNPICCFAPGTGGDSFQLDMATTTVPIG
jgi:LDH2 family malate/lactate/ureidoglycolate dehydrogenase